MALSLLGGRELHVVAVEVCQIGVVVVGSRKFYALERDLSQRLDACLVEGDAAPVEDGNVAVATFGGETADQFPQSAADHQFGSKPEKLGKGPQGVGVAMVEDGIALGDALRQPLDPFAGDVGIVLHREYIDEDTLGVG